MIAPHCHYINVSGRQAAAMAAVAAASSEGIVIGGMDVLKCT